MNKIMLVDIRKLTCHEKVDKNRLYKLQKEIEARQAIYKPIIVDRRSYVILDGHHRYTVLKQLGARKVPVYFVDYLSPNVKVYLRRKNLQMRILKEAVIAMAKVKRVFPSKTTRHVIVDRPRSKLITIQTLL
jgi:ParB-like chromosome segregation protein Spo0J